MFWNSVKNFPKYKMLLETRYLLPRIGKKMNLLVHLQIKDESRIISVNTQSVLFIEYLTHTVNLTKVSSGLIRKPVERLSTWQCQGRRFANRHTLSSRVDALKEEKNFRQSSSQSSCHSTSVTVVLMRQVIYDRLPFTRQTDAVALMALGASWLLKLHILVVYCPCARWSKPPQVTSLKLWTRLKRRMEILFKFHFESEVFSLVKKISLNRKRFTESRNQSLVIVGHSVISRPIICWYQRFWSKVFAKWKGTIDRDILLLTRTAK